jgi:hypothetical protein
VDDLYAIAHWSAMAFLCAVPILVSAETINNPLQRFFLQLYAWVCLYRFLRVNALTRAVTNHTIGP